MIYAQMFFTGLIALFADYFYLKVLWFNWTTPQYRQSLIGDPYLLAMAVVASLWYVASLKLPKKGKWAFFTCFGLHLLVFIYACFLSAAGFFSSSSNSESYGSALAVVVGVPFVIIDGKFLYWLFTKRSELLPPHNKQTSSSNRIG